MGLTDSEAFSIERVGKSGSKFDPEKAKWFNHSWLMQRSDNQLALEFRDYLRAQGHHHDIGDLETIVGMVKERVNFVKDIWSETDFFFRAPESYDKEVIRKRWLSEMPGQMLELKSVLESMDRFT